MQNRNETTRIEPWYALRCKPNFEFVVADQLDGKAIKNYLPTLSTKPANIRSRTTKPYFPGYLFVKGEVAALYSQRVGLMRGVVGLVSFDDVPASISAEVLRQIQKQVQAEERSQNHESGHLRNGDRVWIDDPMLQGFEARFDRCLNGEERVAVLLKMLAGRTVRLELPTEKVRKREK